MSTSNDSKNKFKNSGTHKYAVQLYYKNDGDIVYYAVYRDPFDLDKNGKPKKKRYKVGLKSEGITERYVKNIRDEIVVKLRQGQFPDYLKKKNTEKPLTFNKLADLYFKERAANHLDGEENKNVKNDKSILKNHLSIFLEKAPQLITNEEIINLKIEKLKVKAPSTVNNMLTLLISILSYGVDNDLIQTKPKIKKLGGIDNARERWFTKEEIFLIYDHLKDNLILTIFVKISLSTGARLETIRAIKRKDINLQEQTVTLVDLKGKAAGKDNATYLGFLNPNIIGELSEFIKGLKPNAYIFQYENGNRVGVDYIQNNLQKLFDQLFNEYLKDSDGKIRDRKNKAVIHTLRHTFATHLAKENTSMNTIQKLLNHSDIKMTDRYAKFLPEKGVNAIKQLDIFKQKLTQ